MNPLLAKEIRLLLPAFVTALLLVLFSGVLGQLAIAPVGGFGNVLLLLLGIVLLALSVFGREFALNTFGLLLAQPQSRAQIWARKMVVLGSAVIFLLVLWGVLDLWVSRRAAAARENLVLEGLFLGLMMLATGLWTTLLLRQVIAAFWFTLLLPILILAATGRSHLLFISVAFLYSVAAFAWSWRYFLRLQETPWTGGVVTFPGLARARGREEVRAPARHPWTALVMKELQLHQFVLLGMGCLFVVHLGVLLLRRAGMDHFSAVAAAALEAFGGIWILVPVVVCATSIAEERRLGTAEALACLPVSPKLQFALKLALALLLGGFLSPLLLWAAEALAGALGVPANIGGLEMKSRGVLGLLCLIFSAVTLVAFYASTLARSVVQALGAGLATIVVTWQLGILASRPEVLANVLVWYGALVFYIGVPVLTFTFLWFAWRNFKWAADTRHFWRRNLGGLALVYGGIALLTSAIYHRVWEIVLPLEPAHGPAQFTLRDPPRLGARGAWDTTVVLPKGRLWVDRLAYRYGRRVMDIPGWDSGFRLGGQWVSLDQEHRVAGTNWTSALSTLRETIAIQSDGSLWASEHPIKRAEFHPEHGPLPAAAAVPPLKRFGTENDWQALIDDVSYASAVLLLKQDGTLWRWRWSTNSPPGLHHAQPYRLGQDADWARALSAGGPVYLWKRDGSAWVMHSVVRDLEASPRHLEPGTMLSRCRTLDHMEFTRLSACWPLQAGLRSDGTLWVWTVLEPLSRLDPQFRMGSLVQVGTGKNWASLAGGWHMLTALRSDGTLWSWEARPWEREFLEVMSKPPRRLSRHHDWVAVGSLWGGVAAVAADGSLWRWWPRGNIYESPQPMISAPRQPEQLGNVLSDISGRSAGAP